MKLQEVIDNKYVVELPQKWMFNEFCEHLGNLGMHWCSGRPFKDYSIDRWSACKEETCVNPSKGDFGHLYEGYTKVKFLDIEEFSFKVGDKVKVTRKWDNNPHCACTGDMDELIGTTGKITHTDIRNNEYCVDDNYYFLSESLERFKIPTVENSNKLETEVTINYQSLIGSFFYTNKVRTIKMIIEFPDRVIVCDTYGDSHDFEDIQLAKNIYK
jgi:hypothetical protein